VQTITVTGGTLFDIANRFLGAATAWTSIASANAITDPWLTGIVTLVIPINSTNWIPPIVQQ
jgi:nucleoid-associated protein YgaU